MYCKYCGTMVNNGNYCPRCGKPIQIQRVYRALPAGITRDKNGVIYWNWQDRDYTLYFYMDSNRVGMKSVPKSKEDTIGSAFRDMVKSGLELAASSIVRSSDAYNGQDLPWDSSGEGVGSTYLTFSAIKKIKRNPRKYEITLKESISSLTLRMNEQQYEYILDCILRYAPNAKVK